MFDADRPIQKSTEDRLNRSTFSKYLARCMLDHRDPHSFVVGLYGGWGVGKTSIINLVVEELHNASNNLLDEEKPIVLNFSAWSYSGQNQIIYSFFRRLSSTLRQIPDLKNRDRIIYLLELYVSFFTRQPIPQILRIKPTFWEKITGRAKRDAYAWESGRDLTLVKAELNSLLLKLNRKIIIIIDNISRLYPEEIKQIFQIVKSMGDYANTAYLLAMDKEQVTKALNKIETNSYGKAFLEKVVQLPFDVPPILQQDLENIFSDRLSEVMLSVPVGAWNTEYWADVYYNSIKYFFENGRDITRYINTLQFGYSRLRDVVNPVDYFAITAIEVFLPEVYEGIRDNKDLFTDLLDQVYIFNEEQLQQDKMRCEEILNRNERLPKEILLELIMQLFPRIRKIYKPYVILYYSDTLARKLKRISSPDLFEAYFRLSMQTGQFSQAEFETILKTVSNALAFDHALMRLNQDERILPFLSKLDANAEKLIADSDIAPVINGLLDNGDLFPMGVRGPLSLDTPMRIHRIIYRLIRRLDSTEERFMLLQQAIANAQKSLYILIHEVKSLEHEHVEESDTFMPVEFRSLTPSQLDSLKKLVVSRIESWAKTQRLDNYPYLLPILKAWREWQEDDSYKKYVLTLVATDVGLLAFLLATLDQPIKEAMIKYEKNKAWEEKLSDIQTFIPLAIVEARAKQVFEDPGFEKLREREQLALLIFLDLVKAKTIKMIPKTTV